MSKLPDWLPGGFKVAAHRWYVDDDRPCWLAQFDPDEKPCERNYRGEPVEAFHFFGRGEIRDHLKLELLGAKLGAPEDDDLLISAFTSRGALDLVALAEWDPRNGGPGCKHHHERFDAKLTPTLKVPALALPLHVLRFASDWDLRAAGERKFTGGFESDLDARLPGIVGDARAQSLPISGGQPSAL